MKRPHRLHWADDDDGGGGGGRTGPVLPETCFS